MQLLGLGFGSNALDRRLASARLHRLHRGVYAVGHRILSREARFMAAVLAGGPGAVLSHRSAAELWSLGPSARHRPEITAAYGRRAGPALEVHHSVLEDDELTERYGIPVTTASRTLLDLAAVLPGHRLERALREAEALRLGDFASLERLLERHPRRRGTAALRSILAAGHIGDGATRSELEERFLAFLDAATLPRPKINVHVEIGDRLIECDCVWHAQRLVVELDGHAIHGRRGAFERDRSRDRGLSVAGWRVLRVTWQQLDREAQAIATDLRCLLDQGSDAPGKPSAARGPPWPPSWASERRVAPIGPAGPANTPLSRTAPRKHPSRPSPPAPSTGR